MRRLLLLAILAGALSSASPAQAGIWTPIPSGTSGAITAIDYQGPTRFWYASAGRLARRVADGTFVAGTGVTPGVVFNDIAFQPGGTVGIAVGNADNVWRSTDSGVNWTKLAVQTTANQGCVSGGANGAAPIGNLYSVSWGVGGVVYLGGDRRTVLRSGSAGAAFSEVNKTTSGCRLGGTGTTGTSDVSELQVVGSGAGQASESVIFQGREAFGPFYATGNGLATTIFKQGGGPNGTSPNTNFVAAPESPNRIWSTNQCGFSCFVRSDDGMASDACVCTVLNAAGSETQGDHYDIAYAGGTVLAVGDNGTIEQSVDGVDFFYARADPPNAARNFRSVDLADAGNAAIGAVDGTLLLTTQAGTVPDIVDPTGVVSGPTVVTAGQPATFTAGVADNAGGTGIDPASFSWTATGTPGGGGNPITLTFPSSGSTTVNVSFKDNAGNVGTATLSVSVRAAVAVVPPIPPIPPKQLSKTITKSASLAGGGSVSLGVPRACIPVGSTFKATLSFKRSTRKGAKAIKVSSVAFTVDKKKATRDKKAPFTKTISVKALKAGSKHTLRARATIKVKRGKSPKKSITASFTVCG